VRRDEASGAIEVDERHSTVAEQRGARELSSSEQAVVDAVALTFARASVEESFPSDQFEQEAV